MSYYLLRQDLMAGGAAGIGEVPEEIEPGDWIRGQVLPPPTDPLRITLSEASGALRSDVIDGLLTLHSTKLKDALSAFGVDNIDYFPVELEDSATGAVERGYWLANIIGLAACVDRDNSTFEPRELGVGLELESFTIDPAKAPEQPIFRLAEDATLVVITEELKQHLAAVGLRGVRFQKTESFDGF